MFIAMCVSESMRIYICVYLQYVWMFIYTHWRYTQADYIPGACCLYYLQLIRCAHLYMPTTHIILYYTYNSKAVNW